MLKKIIFFLTLGAGIIACQNDDKKVSKSPEYDSAAMANAIEDSANYTTIEWLDSTYIDLGKQPEGKSIELTFRFKNSGTKNLVIRDVSAQCGCTIPEKPGKPFAPGEEGVIRATFNGSGHGEIRKEVYVQANTTPSTTHNLSFHAELIK